MFKVAVGEVEVPDVEFEDACDGEVILNGTLVLVLALGFFLTTSPPPLSIAPKENLRTRELERTSVMSIQVLRACVELSKEEFVVSFCEVRQRIEIAFISVSKQIEISPTTMITHLEIFFTSVKDPHPHS